MCAQTHQKQYKFLEQLGSCVT